MVRTSVLVWALLAFLLSANSIDALESLGVNWGTQAAQNLDPTVIIQLLKDNGIRKIKLFDSDHWTVKHFAGTGIQVMLGIPNAHLSRLQDYDHAKDWVKNNVSKHLYDGGVDIKYVAVGNEPFLKAYNGSFEKLIFPALKNVQKALDKAGHGDKIKATIPQNADVYDSGSNAPSEGHFRDDINDLMTDIVQFLKDHNAPFVVNIYPFLSLYQNPHFPVDFAFFDGGAQPVQDKNNVQYTNMYDANLDTLVWSLKKAGAPDVSIIVGEIGWPTGGNINANTKLAKKFYDGFLKKMASKKGSPLHSLPIEVYLFSLQDENMKSVAPGHFERHWGIFRYDGQPKFPIDFSGQGNDKMPTGAKNVPYLAHQWCVFNSSKNISGSDIEPNMNYACANGDCTSLGYGGSCRHLDKKGSISYAFNMYFQMQNQDVEACVFQGLAKIVKTNASTSECLFPIALESVGRRLSLGRVASMLSGVVILLALF